MSGLSVAQTWFPQAPQPLQFLTAALHRCARETGWTVQRPGLFAPDVDALLEAAVFTSPRGELQLQLRRRAGTPIIGFVEQAAFRAGMDVWGDPGQSHRTQPLWHSTPWRYPYLDTELTLWWQSAGWMLPDAAWLNAEPDANERARLSTKQPGALDSHRGLSRGDLLFFSRE